MAVKFYSDVTKQFYESADAAQTAEQETEKKLAARDVKRKEMAKRVDSAREALDEATKVYNEALEAFCKEYGTYHYSIGAKDLEKEIARIKRTFWLW